MAGTQIADGIINPPIDELLEVVDSKYRLVIMAAKRARQINAYYSQLGEGLLEYVGPLVETRSQEKPLSIALREINGTAARASSPSTSDSGSTQHARPRRPRRRRRASPRTRPWSCCGADRIRP